MRYRVADPEALVDAMVTFRRTLMDEAVDRFLASWLEMHPRHLAAAGPGAAAAPAPERAEAKKE